MKKEKKPTVVESSKRLLVISPSPNNPALSPLISLFLNLLQNSVKYTDKDGVYQPTASNTSVSNGRLEGLMKKKECSLFVYLYCNKSNEPRIIIGRTHEYSITDLVQYKVNHEVKDVNMLRNMLHILLLHRDPHSTDAHSQNMLLDLLRDSIPPAVGLGVIKYGLGINVEEKTITLDLLEIEASPFKLVHILGPITLTVLEEHRMKLQQHKEASKSVRQTEKKIKNVEKGPLNSRMGVLHLERQDLREVQLSKGRALRGRK
ncbi:ribosome production factor 2 [Nematocida minor]|uniref:ribosome production factor 2 n=1 Tax=Nematocida minor TaxID=1912983 RepID=UPI0022201DA0|nr:ribosome production factor 2 [Nematocida minor]KAI5192832.1 ribosome production factor 2 [Nematocida minor]